MAGLKTVRALELFIDPEQWGRGLGGAALRRLLDELFATGAEAVVVEPAMANERANRAYERAGFRRLAQTAGGWLMVARPPGTAGPRQQVPRPLGSRPGAPAPWEALPAEQRRSIRVDDVRAALDRVGGLETFPAPFGRVAAAVLIPLFEEDGEARVILTRRAAHLTTEPPARHLTATLFDRSAAVSPARCPKTTSPPSGAKRGGSAGRRGQGWAGMSDR